MSLHLKGGVCDCARAQSSRFTNEQRGGHDPGLAVPTCAGPEGRNDTLPPPRPCCAALIASAIEGKSAQGYSSASDFGSVPPRGRVKIAKSRTAPRTTEGTIPSKNVRSIRIPFAGRTGKSRSEKHLGRRHGQR